MEHVQLPTSVRLDRDICNDLPSAESREVLVANGIGGYSSLTLANSLTRSYHGLLIAALRPPLDRTLLLSKLNETVLYSNQDYHLYTDRRIRRDLGTTTSNQRLYEVVNPEGFKLVESFHLEGTVPVFRYSFGDAILEKKLWMKRGQNTVYVTYHLPRASQPVRLRINALVNYRNHHYRTSAHDPGFTHAVDVNHDTSSVNIRFTKQLQQTTLNMLVSDGRSELVNQWITGFALDEERSRGLPAIDDHIHAATFITEIPPGRQITFVATAEDEVSNIDLDGYAELALYHVYEKQLLERFNDTRKVLVAGNYRLHKQSGVNKHATASASRSGAPQQMGAQDLEDSIKQMVLAADQFIISRNSGYSVIAGFHWFTDWARDTMISLPGLTIATGRYEVARSILHTFSRYVSEGMLPNRFPDDGSDPSEADYNNVDGTLWFFEAVRSYFKATGDTELLQELYPVLRQIIEHHCKGTRFGIRQDSDGLLEAGAEGVALTWMDAKTDIVHTQRDGKPVEVSALWFNALRCMSFFASKLGHKEQSSSFDQMAQTTKTSFQKRFWNSHTVYCYDVIDGGRNKTGKDSSLRPNQLIAASLGWTPLTEEQRALVLEACTRHLLTPHSIRSLSPTDKNYKGVYEGDLDSRDSAYHQGVGWTWLLGPLVLANLQVHGDKERSRQYLLPLLKSHLSEAGMGQVSELFDGDAPYRAKGCIAQAWSVAELLRACLATAPDEGSPTAREA